MDMHTLHVRRVLGVVRGWIMKEQGVLTNLLSLASSVAARQPMWLCQHNVAARLGRYLHELRGRGHKMKATDGQN